MFLRGGNHGFNGATNKGKNMLPMGSIFFPLNISPIRIETNWKWALKWETAKLKLRQFVRLLQLPNFPEYSTVLSTLVNKAQTTALLNEKKMEI